MKKRLLAILATAAIVTAGLVGCSSSPAVPMPASMVVTYQGTAYCGYRYSPYEIDMYGRSLTCTRVAFPSISMVPAPGTLQYALAGQYATYSSWYDSGWYYDTYLSPIPGRYHTTIIITRTSFLSNASIAKSTYGTLIRTDSSKARYVGKNGATVSKYNFPTSNKSIKNTGPVTNTGTSRNASNSSLFGGSGSTSNQKPTTPNRGTTGKSGRR